MLFPIMSLLFLNFSLVSSTTMFKFLKISTGRASSMNHFGRSFRFDFTVKTKTRKVNIFVPQPLLACIQKLKNLNPSNFHESPEVEVIQQNNKTE